MTTDRWWFYGHIPTTIWWACQLVAADSSPPPPQFRADFKIDFPIWNGSSDDAFFLHWRLSSKLINFDQGVNGRVTLNAFYPIFLSLAWTFWHPIPPSSFCVKHRNFVQRISGRWSRYDPCASFVRDGLPEIITWIQVFLFSSLTITLFCFWCHLEVNVDLEDH
jgi:hypothetical protein